MYNKIFNPKTKRFVNINSTSGKFILKNYLLNIKGGSTRMDKKIYLESQISLWCGSHSINNVLQKDIVRAGDLKTREPYSLDDPLYINGKLNLFRLSKNIGLSSRNKTDKSEKRDNDLLRCPICDLYFDVSIIDESNRIRPDGKDLSTILQDWEIELGMNWKTKKIYDAVKRILYKCKTDPSDIQLV